MDKNLIFDLGFYNGDTSLEYLKGGFKVIGVDCNPLLELKDGKINEYLNEGHLILEKKMYCRKGWWNN